MLSNNKTMEMKYIKNTCVILGLISLFNLKAQENKKDYTSDIKTFIKGFPTNTELSVLVIDVDNSEFIGVKKLNDTVDVIDNKESIFEIGSITKVFTNILLSNSVQKGESSLNETLQSNFNFKIYKGDSITLQQLSNHSSGLPVLPTNIYSKMEKTPDNPYKNYTEEDLLAYLKTDLDYAFKSGTKSIYSNLGMGLLGYIITKKENKSYEKLLKEVIFNPLSMNSSSMNLINKDKLVKGLNEDGSIASNWDFTDAMVGAGGIKSTTKDMEKFIRKNFENDALYTLPLQETYAKNKVAKIGLGWQIIDNKNKKFYWHNGATGGYRSCLVFSKQSKKAVLVLSNISAFNSKSASVDNLCFSIFKKLIK